MGNVWSLRLLGYFSRPLSGLLISFPYPQFCSGIFGIFIYSLPTFYWGNLLVWAPLSAFTDLAPLRPISSFPHYFQNCVWPLFLGWPASTSILVLLLLLQCSNRLSRVQKCLGFLKALHESEMQVIF